MNLKALTSIILFIVISCNVICQTSEKLEIYKNISDTTKHVELSITKEEFLKLDSLIIDPKDSRWFEYTIVITGKRKNLEFRQSKGPVIKLDSQIKQWVKETDDCVISIDEVRVLWFKEGDKRYPPVMIFIK